MNIQFSEQENLETEAIINLLLGTSEKLIPRKENIIKSAIAISLAILFCIVNQSWIYFLPFASLLFVSVSCFPFSYLKPFKVQFEEIMLETNRDWQIINRLEAYSKKSLILLKANFLIISAHFESKLEYSQIIVYFSVFVSGLTLLFISNIVAQTGQFLFWTVELTCPIVALFAAVNYQSSLEQYHISRRCLHLLDFALKLR